MRVVFQRVFSAKVTVEGETVGEIGPGALLLVGITHEDGDREVEWMANKIAGLRVFSDEEGRLNLSLQDVGGSALAVSNFTLYGNASHGRRPDYIAAAHSETAKPLFDAFVQRLSKLVPVQTGRFGAHMKVDAEGNGPVTILLDTATDMHR